jgi:hypothetical protein
VYYSPNSIYAGGYYCQVHSGHSITLCRGVVLT